MTTTALVLLIIFIPPMPHSQTDKPNAPAVEEHIRSLVKDLPADSSLRRSLLQGARGNGVHYPWMDEMRKQEIKKALVSVDIRFDHKGRPRQMSIKRVEYFCQYENDRPISGNVRLDKVRSTGLENKLKSLALERARKGFWFDVPRPRPNPFIGGTEVEFLDDEWLPVLSAPIYYVGAGGPQIGR